MSEQVKFEFSAKLQKKLGKAGSDYFETLYAACLEASEAGVIARDFPTHLRGAGFPCSTAAARAAYKAVRGGADADAVAAIVDKVAAAARAAAAAARAAEAAEVEAADTEAAEVEAAEADTLVGALTAALAAAKAGHLDVAETWLGKAASILAAAKIATAGAIEKMGGVAEKSA